MLPVENEVVRVFSITVGSDLLRYKLFLDLTMRSIKTLKRIATSEYLKEKWEREI